jgi:hypothetical protein
MNDVADADDHAVHPNVRNRCGSSKMRDDDDEFDLPAVLMLFVLFCGGCVEVLLPRLT